MSSITNRDYTAVMALTIVSSAVLLIAVFIIDIIYVLIDPRIKLHDN